MELRNSHARCMHALIYARARVQPRGGRGSTRIHVNANGTKIKKILRAGSKIGARAIEKQIINLPQPNKNILFYIYF